MVKLTKDIIPNIIIHLATITQIVYESNVELSNNPKIYYSQFINYPDKSFHQDLCLSCIKCFFFNIDIWVYGCHIGKRK